MSSCQRGTSLPRIVIIAVRDRPSLGSIASSPLVAAVPGLAAALHGVRKLPPPRYDDASWSFIEALLVVLPRVAARLELVFAQASAIDFSEARCAGRSR